MIRTRTVMVIGAGASCELQMPSGADLLARIVQGYDFSRLGTESQSRESVMLARHLSKLAERMGREQREIIVAAQALRNAARVGKSIDAIIEQYDHDPLVVACGKLAIAFFVGQAETRATLREAPRVAGELPIQGKPEETWLYWLGQLFTAGLPRSKLEKAFADLTIVSFNYDRSIEHFLPHALVMAYGLTLKEAQAIVAQHLVILHPYGSVGRLPWQLGQDAQAEWAGSEQPWNIHAIANQIRTCSERLADREWTGRLRRSVAEAKRIVFLGFGFHPQNLDLLFDRTISHNPDVLASIHGLPASNRPLLARQIKRLCGLEFDDLLTLENARAFETLRDHALMLES
ncbi:hypothetical protein OLX02_18010 [Novosphingobium sp. KCTC 2891]|uniref:hypothetical protein n=1 Tax=Novosphingobium sp. KCTC 2891 TaxID=2989730 RepID=UPI002223A90F|nr:hypothetical protein [Novosphingobium sp. KCTC 2891]MCW1384715.1 hypothetical protein [Novosphingobium sp. KCTC 2891]